MRPRAGSASAARAGRRRRRAARGPRSGRPSRPRGRSRARPRRPSATAAARRARVGRATAARGSRGRSRGRGRGRSAGQRPSASMTLAGDAVERRARTAASSSPSTRRPRAAAIAAACARGDELVDREVPLRRLADEQRPGHVAAVARRPGPRSRTAGPTRRGPAGRPASRAAAPPRARRGRRRRRRAASAPPVRISHSRLEGEVALGHAGPDLRQQRRQRPVGDRAGGRDPLELGRLLDRPVGLDPALDRDELDVRRRRRQPAPERVRDEPGLDRRPAAPRPMPTSVRPARRQVVVGRRRSARPGASRPAWIV